MILVPSDAFGENGVILPYLQDYSEKWEILNEDKSFQIGKITVEIPIKHGHSVETYGLIIKTKECTFSWIVDIQYFDELCIVYRGELLILIMVLQKQIEIIDHLSIPDIKQLIQDKSKSRNTNVLWYGCLES